jgi:ketosteroid isomerase-like protein
VRLRYVGRERVFEFFIDRASMFTQVEIEIEDLLEKDDRVLAFIRLTGSGAASGAGFEIRIAHLWTLREGMVVRGQGYGDRAAALQAFGMPQAGPSREAIDADRPPPEADLRREDVMRRRLK